MRRSAKLATEENFPSYAAGVDKDVEERGGKRLGLERGGIGYRSGETQSALMRTSVPALLHPPAHQARLSRGCGSAVLQLACLSYGRKVRRGFRKRVRASNGPASFTIAT